MSVHELKNTRPYLAFHQGTLILKNYPYEPDPICLRWDRRSYQWRAKAMYYKEIVRWLDFKMIPFTNAASSFSRLNLCLPTETALHPFQQEAVSAWQRAKKSGSICLPTGTGKSWVALQAMAVSKTSTLVVVPTLDLLHQWYALISTTFGVPVGLLGGSYHNIRDITVTTYDSAYIHMDKYGARFGLLVFDEVHHLPSTMYSHIPEMCIAPYRLGLTATYSRPDGRHGKLEGLIGPLVYEKSIVNLKGSHLAEYKTKKISVKLTHEEKAEYRKFQKIYLDYVREKKIKFKGHDLKPLLQRSGDEKARGALLARMHARCIQLGAKSKLDVLESLLKEHAKDRVLIFTASNDFVYSISETFLIPAITHHTKAKERKWILDSFRHGTYSVLVTSRVLNEGVDIPSANVAIILSGSASPVEHLQRLGRILRKSKNKQAVLYELVTSGTKESQISFRRRQSDAYR